MLKNNIKFKFEMAISNPWGVDENNYFTSVGGIGAFLNFSDTLY